MMLPRFVAGGPRVWTALAAIWGCSVCGAGALGKDAPTNQITFSKHIAPILWENCASCHRPGEVGPFSLLTYEDAAKRAEFIAEITESRRMPPWKAEPGFYKFHDERRLTDRELALIAKWAEQGAPEGDPKDLPAKPEFAHGWQLGEPDLVLKMKESFQIPATGRDIYRCFVIPIPTDKDKYVSAVEFRPGNHKVVHHAIFFLDANEQGRKKDGVDGKMGFVSFGGPGILPTGSLGSWVPGAMPRHLPEGVVKYVKKGSDLVMQIHYHPSGKAEEDQSSLGIYYTKTQFSKIVSGIAVMQTSLKIPANDAHCEITAETSPLPVDTEVLAVNPHMHNLGREVKVTVTRPGRTNDATLIEINDWDFNWQGAYYFARPVHLAKGSVVKVQSIYDNSANNPKNPNTPPKEVHWGEQTEDEMLLCTLQVTAEKPSELRQIVTMKGNEMGAALEGGVPGQAAVVKRMTEEREKGERATSKKEGLSQARTSGKKMSVKEQARAANEAKKAAGKKAADDKPAEDGSEPKVPAARVANTATSPAAVPDEPAAAPMRVAAAPMPPASGPASAVIVKLAKDARKKYPVPKDGAPIPESIQTLGETFDLDKNGKFTPDEIDKMDPGTQLIVLRNIGVEARRKAGTGKK